MSFSLLLADLVDNIDDLPEPARLHAVFDLCWEHDLEEFPERATALGVPGHGHRWTDRSESAIARRQEEQRQVLDALASIDESSLDETDRLSLALFRREHERLVAGHRFPSECLPVTKMTGPHLSLARTFSQMPATQLGHFEDVVARLHGVGVHVDQIIALLDEGRARGLTPPRVTIDDVPAQIDALVDPPSGRSPFLAAFDNHPETVDPAELDELRAEADNALQAATLPALRRLREHLQSTYLPACRETVAWSDLPDGEAWYEHLVATYTTTDLTVKDIHELGHSEVARIRAEMDDAIQATGFEGTFDEFCEHLRTHPRFYHSDPDALLAGYRDIAKRVDAELPKLFGMLPRLPYGVCPVPDHEAPSTTTAYYLRGSLRAGRPGWFAANTYDLPSRPIWEMEALTLHEAVPGHHLQIALAAELEGLPSFRTQGFGYTAYVEGWGLYAEKLGAEMGFYRDPYSRFGQLTYEMWRAVRLVVDTGIHAFGWSRQQAIDFFSANSSKPIHDITVEIDRYISWPAQALAYKLGELTFLRLRAEAADALGDRFDVREFHDHVLGAGALPLDVLEARFRGWLAGRR